MDVHQATISVAVMDSTGKLILESILETKATTILQFLGGLCGSLLVTFEEGTSAAWLYDLLKPHVANVLVCDPRKNALLRMAARVTGSTLGNWPNSCGATISHRSTTERTGYGL
jgi:hypothetical protein